MKIIYHHKDLDGVTSGAILHRKYPEAELIGYDYGEPFDISTICDPCETVIMADVSLPMNKMMMLADRCRGNFVWIDHHKSAIDDLAGTTVRTPFTAVLQVGISACELCWEWANPGTYMPLGVLLLGRYDTWRKNEGLWDEATLPFQYGMRVEGYTPKTMPDWVFGSAIGGTIDIEDLIEVERVISIGEKILAYQKSQNEYNCQYAFEARINIEGTNLRAICCNKAPHNSMSFEPVWDEEKYDVMVPFGFDGKTWAFSFYTTKAGMDCSWIAKQFGGGGHVQASGCKADDLRKVLIF
jgi:oligoribonuclease NrnB/cAMP/cGMP phosphodiesterase (DHH superfamily)